MDLTKYRIRESIRIAAPPDQVWARVSDISRMGDVSPLCTGCSWDEPATGMAVGAWFAGTNKAGEYEYTTRCQIDAVEPGTSFSFVNNGIDGESPTARWAYEVRPADGGTELTETRELLPTFAEAIRAYDSEADIEQVAAERTAGMVQGVNATLAALKVELEA
jgi:uncharacterized protein YndB with AHSA1/START domain